MKTYLLLILFIVALFNISFSQNVFSPADAIVRYDKSKSYGSSQRPDTNRLGLQKWVSTPMSGVSTGSSTWDASSFKAYFLNMKGNKMSFRIKFPKSYTTDPSKRYPVMIFLHGAGEVGCATNNGLYNNEKQLQLGGKLFMDGVNAGKFDGFLIYPQLIARSGCWDAWGSAATAKLTSVMSMVDSLVKYARLDVDRVIINGLSGGGYGAWRFAAIMPMRIAKIIPSAAAGSTTSRDAFVHIPIWFATGGKDPSPSPATAAYVLGRMKQIGADIRYTQYPELGHAVWYNHWKEPDYFTYMNDTHKANPLVFFQKTDFCSGTSVNTKIGISAGFYAYEWQKDNVTIATKTGSTTSVLNSAVVSAFTGNDITVKAYGSYKVRFKRTSYSAWSSYSPKPALIKVLSSASAAIISINGTRSKVLPALDGSTTVPLMLPAGFSSYQWVRVSDNAVVSASQFYSAPVGVYKARYNNTSGCSFAYSPNYTVPSASTGSPKPAAATGLTATALSLTSTRLNWSQGAGETGFEIYRSASPGGPYTLLTITVANAISYTDNGLDANSTYYYVVRAVNDTGGAVKSNEASPDGGNTAPVIPALSDMYVKSGTAATKNFTVTDNAGDVVTVTLSVTPSFVTLTNLSGGNYRINVNATQNDVGLTELEVVAKDNGGKVSSKKFNVVVADKNIRSVFVNFGAYGKTALSPWNNWLGIRAAGSVISNLKDEANVTTTFDVTMVSGWSATTSLGHMTGNNSGIFPDKVLESGIADNGAAKQIKISGLSTSKRYNLVFVGSQNEGLIATADYVVGTQKSSLDARYNTTRTANLNSLTPDGSGNITVTITRTGASAFTYLNGLAIEEYDPSITLLNPANLYVEPIDRTSVNVSWSDKTNNEAASGGYQLQRATNATFTTGLATITLAGNVTFYKNTGLAANTKYYYRVRAKNGSSVSAYSNVMATITPNTIVYVNFNTTIAGGPLPWNNLAGSSVTTFTKSALKNQSGTATAMSLKLTKTFNGEFTAGRRTGNNSGVVPDNVLQSDYWIDNSQVAQIQLSGLSSTKRYRIGFFGSSSAAGWTKGNYTASYTVNNRTVYLNSWENTTKVIYIGNIVPSSGVITMDFSTTAAAQYGFNGGVIIEEYTDSQGGVVTNSTLDTAGINEIVPLLPGYNVIVYPNPFNDVINLDFNNASASDRISAEVYDLTGRLIAKQEFNSLPAGHNTIRLTGIERGRNTSLYLVALKANGKIVQAVKMLRMR